MAAPFAHTPPGQRVIGNKINTGYAMPDGWSNSEPTEPTWKMGGSEERCDWAMLLLQPDTSLDLKAKACSIHTYIQMFKKTEDLVEVIQTQTPEQLEKLMGLSAKTAKSHYDRFKQFHKLPPKQACLILGGEKLGADDFSDVDKKFCESHLRFVSGLYGVLRPYDDVKPVRDVPMTGALTTKRGSTIADFWGDAITKHLVKEMQGNKSTKPLLVCAVSNDYLRAVQLEDLPKDVRSVRVEFEGGSEKETTKARALFGRHFVKKQISHSDQVRDFEHEDWLLEKFKSNSSRVVFTWVGGQTGGEKKNGKKDKKDKERAGSPAARSRSGSPRAKKRRAPSASSGEAPARGKQASKRADREGSRSPSQSRQSRSRGRRGESKREKAERSPRRERAERSPPRRKRKIRSDSL